MIRSSDSAAGLLCGFRAGQRFPWTASRPLRILRLSRPAPGLFRRLWRRRPPFPPLWPMAIKFCQSAANAIEEQPDAPAKRPSLSGPLPGLKRISVARLTSSRPLILDSGIRFGVSCIFWGFFADFFIAQNVCLTHVLLLASDISCFVLVRGVE